MYLFLLLFLSKPIALRTLKVQMMCTQWGIAPGMGSGGTTPLGVGGTGTSSLDGDVDQAMLNLALDAPVPAVFGGVSWNANPVPSFDLVDSSSSTTESRFGAVFQIPLSSSEVQVCVEHETR